jgi:hypothetical protein
VAGEAENKTPVAQVEDASRVWFAVSVRMPPITRLRGIRMTLTVIDDFIRGLQDELG